jgi:hypothetical protein
MRCKVQKVFFTPKHFYLTREKASSLLSEGYESGYKYSKRRARRGVLYVGFHWIHIFSSDATTFLDFPNGGYNCIVVWGKREVSPGKSPDTFYEDFYLTQPSPPHVRVLCASQSWGLWVFKKKLVYFPQTFPLCKCLAMSFSMPFLHHFNLPNIY